ncbi:hypothetical protein BDQ17DRAFT_1436106 [Cyathus striatus]|nr:hypothetical protein BDQ17DRAFT_1436106 [Cyathus striatus]
MDRMEVDANISDMYLPKLMQFRYDNGVKIAEPTTPTASSTPTQPSSSGSGTGADKHKGAMIGIAIGRQKNISQLEGEPPIPVPFFSIRQGNIDVVHNPMHAPPRPKVPTRDRAVEQNIAELGTMEEKTRPPSLVAVAAAPVEIAELLEENNILRRRLADFTESVAGGTPPPTYHEDDENED